jgi:hypothetical protein
MNRFNFVSFLLVFQFGRFLIHRTVRRMTMQKTMQKEKLWTTYWKKEYQENKYWENNHWYNYFEQELVNALDDEGTRKNRKVGEQIPHVGRPRTLPSTAPVLGTWIYLWRIKKVSFDSIRLYVYEYQSQAYIFRMMIASSSHRPFIKS